MGRLKGGTNIFKDVLRSHFQYWKCDDLRKVIEEAVH